MMRHLTLSILPLAFLPPVVMAQTLAPFERSEVRLVRVSEGLGIQLNLRNKPITRYANVVYQLLVRRNGAWLPVYSTTGARLLPGGGGTLNPPLEVIPLWELEPKLGGRLEQLGNAELQAVVTIRYDLSSDRRDLVWNGVTTQVLGTLTGGTQSVTALPPK
ncbi:MAG: hypothetical protein HC919_07125 [Oscillatoriales cyanobacterium SM2_2_1]|nr:hypothetical protein [Oscillatoriales cyanobacterium SM2_2_1]